MQIWSVGRILFADRAFILFADRVFILLLFADADGAAKPHLLHAHTCLQVVCRPAAGDRKNEMKAFCNFLSGFCDSTLDVKWLSQPAIDQHRFKRQEGNAVGN